MLLFACETCVTCLKWIIECVVVSVVNIFFAVVDGVDVVVDVIVARFIGELL